MSLYKHSASTLRLLKDTGARIPIVCGPMYPGSNPELVAAVSKSGGFGVVQPIALTRLYGKDFEGGLKNIKENAGGSPFGVNITILPNTAASAKYAKINEEYARVAIESGCKFLLTSLGKPHDIVKTAHLSGVKVYHDVHNIKVALQAIDAGVDGLNLLNNRMGGQTGSQSAESFMEDARKAGIPSDFPMICAGGISTPEDMRKMLDLGYAGVQCGTRFLATHECIVTKEYKDAIVASSEKDIVYTNKMAGTESSVILTDQVAKGGLRTNAFVTFLLKHPMTKSITRLYLLSGALEKYDQAAFDPNVQYWQAGKGVDGIHEILSVEEVCRNFETGLELASNSNEQIQSKL